MAASASISGLVSGLDTATIISQLMQVEAQPQTLLKTRVTSGQTDIGSLQSLNAKFAALTTKAAALATATSWSPLSTTSSSTSVTALAGSTASAGRLSLTVQQTASATTLAFKQTPLATDVVTSGDTAVRLTAPNGDTVDLDTGDGTLSGLISAVNSSGAGVTASAVKLDDGTYRLQMVSDTTGAASGFSLTNTDDTPILGGAVVTAGQDAAITVGSDLIHSASNTFTGLTTGLDVTIAAGTPAGTAVDITTTRDAAAAQAAAKGLVDAANDILTTIDKLTAYDATTKKSASLSGDSALRDIRTRVLEAVSRSADGSSMAGMGISTDRYGAVTFDATKFASAYATDPAGVANVLGAPSTSLVPGLAARLAAASKTVSDSTTGILTSDISGRQTSMTRMQKSIDDWDVKLQSKQDSLTRQYAALEVALGKMKDQSSWLAGQIANLPSASSSS